MAHKRQGVIHGIAEHPFGFAVAFMVFFFLTYGFLLMVDAVPEPSNTDTSSVTHTNTASDIPTNPEAPVRVVAPKIGLNVTVANPQSTDLEVLDNALLKGAVRYPTSAQLGVNGTVLLFGHSSYLPIVHNQAYKAFDGIQNLKNGDIVSVYSGTHEYQYAVTGVRVADATEDVVELPQTGKHLTLVTCDSFSKKTNRFVVTADFVGAYLLSN